MKGFVFILLGAATLALYGPTVRYDFVGWDDDIHVYENPYLNPASTANTLHFWKEPYRKLYVPLTYTFWFGMAWTIQHGDGPTSDLRRSPAPFHALNVLLHLFNVCLVYSLLLALVQRTEGAASAHPPRSPPIEWIAGAGALLFAWHPLQVEAVAWVSGLKDLLAGFFSLVALRGYVAYAGADSRRAGRARYCLGTAACALALLAKPSSAVTPLIALILDVRFLRRGWRAALPAVFPWLALSAAALVFTSHLQPVPAVAASTPLLPRPIIALDSCAWYMAKLVLPFGLAPDYGRTPSYVLSSTWAWCSWILPAGVGVWLWRARKTGYLPAAAIFVAGVLPVSGLVAFEHQAYSTVADRYVYLAMLGPALALSQLMVDHGRDIASGFLCAALLVCFSLRSANQAVFWHDSFALFDRTLKVNPRSASAENNLCYALAEVGRNQEAAPHCEAALRLKPDYGTARLNLGDIAFFQGKYEEAAAHFQQALGSSLPEDRVNGHNGLGLCLDRLGREGEAAEQFETAMRLAPNDGSAYNNLATLRAKQGASDEALTLYAKAVALLPNKPGVRSNLAMLLNNLGYAEARKGKWAEAEERYKEALENKPDYLTAVVNLGQAYLDQGHPDAAIRFWRKSLGVLPKSPELRYNLAVASFRRDDLDGARGYLKEALKIRPTFLPAGRMLSDLLGKRNIDRRPLGGLSSIRH